VRFSVVIPAWNEAERIEATVRSAVATDVEVMVVDGGSGDATASRAAGAGARVVTSERGRAVQLARGASAARGDVLVFLHADTALPVGWPEAVATALADPAVVGGAFSFRFERGGSTRLGFALALVEWGARLRVALFGFPYGDQALFVRRGALDAAGGVPQTPFMEDLDLVAALRRQGRLALLALPAVTSARRYRARGPLRAMLRNWAAVLAWWLGLDRARVAAWYHGAGAPGPR
jgi:rSAM/selenodomain-associated transferase 2